MLDFRPHARFDFVPGSIPVTQRTVAKAFLVRKIFRLGRMLAHHLTLPSVGRITPHASLITMQSITQQLTVVHVRGSSHHRMNQLALAVDANVCLHAEVPDCVAIS